MTEKKTSESQLKASRKWQDKSKEHMNYLRKKSAVRSFMKIATLEDTAELEQLIQLRKDDLSS